jgi:hypothetical protein
MRGVAELHDSLRHLVGMGLLIGGVRQALLGHALRLDPRSQKAMALGAEHTDNFRGECLIEEPNHRVAIGPIPSRDGTVFDMLPRPGPEGLHIGHKGLIGHIHS